MGKVENLKVSSSSNKGQRTDKHYCDHADENDTCREGETGKKAKSSGLGGKQPIGQTVAGDIGAEICFTLAAFLIQARRINSTICRQSVVNAIRLEIVGIALDKAIWAWNGVNTQVGQVHDSVEPEKLLNLRKLPDTQLINARQTHHPWEKMTMPITLCNQMLWSSGRKCEKFSFRKKVSVCRVTLKKEIFTHIDRCVQSHMSFGVPRLSTKTGAFATFHEF